ncbi:MAG: hypothetical protein JRE40_07990 [Deltaproteobacteria bacterium]|nr:hypothetical protein [Deltaproteobacteria bacterium]
MSKGASSGGENVGEYCQRGPEFWLKVLTLARRMRAPSSEGVRLEDVIGEVIRAVEEIERVR